MNHTCFSTNVQPKYLFLIEKKGLILYFCPEHNFKIE